MSVFGLGLLLMVPAEGPGQSLRAVRRSDRHALVLLLADRTVGGDPNLPDAGKDAVKTQGFRLIDLTSSVALALAPRSEVAPKACPRSPEAPWPSDRVCIALATSTDVLGDTHRYVLYIDTLVGWKDGKADTVRDLSVFLPPAAGAVVAPTAEIATDVEVDYDVDLTDLSATPDIELRIFIDKKQASVVTGGAAAGRSRCLYRPGALAFRCPLERALRAGQSITAQLTHMDGSEFPVAGPIKKAAYKGVEDKTNLKTTDPSNARLYLKGSYTRTATSETRSVELLIQNWSIPGTVWGQGRLSGDFSPYIGLLTSSDPKTAGYFNVGLRSETFITDLGGPFELAALFVTPQVESDKGATVSNFIYLNPELKIGIKGIFAGGLPGDGFYRAWPGFGMERGTTIKGDTVTRPESSDPSRWKATAVLRLQWPGRPASKFPFAGVRIDGEARQYWLDRVPPVAAREHRYSSISALYKLTEHTGLAYSWKEGDIPPLFKRQRVTDVSFTVIY